MEITRKLHGSNERRVLANVCHMVLAQLIPTFIGTYRHQHSRYHEGICAGDVALTVDMASCSWCEARGLAR